VSYVSPSANGSLNFTPAKNQYGTATITVTVNDSQSANSTVSRPFTVTVNAVNQPPTLEPINNVGIDENASIQTVVLESAVMTLFVIAAVAGFKGSAWITVAALAGHGVQDAVHGHIVANAGVPAWWPAWCLAYDVGAAGALAWLLMRGNLPTSSK